MVWGTPIPKSSPSFQHQTAPSECTDVFFKHLFQPPSFVPIHRFFQIVTFVVFLGPIKLFLGLVTFVLLVIAAMVLPLFSRFFATPLKFKHWAYGIIHHLVRLFLFSIGVFWLKIEGDPVPNSRVFVSNSVSFLDYLVHFCANPSTIVTGFQIPGFLVGSIFDSFRLDIRTRAKKDVYRIRDCALDPSYDPPMLFPEGSTTNGGAVIRFANEFFDQCAEHRYQVQPVAIQYWLALTPPGFNSLAFAQCSALGVAFRLLAVPWIWVTISYLHAELPKTGDKDGIKYATGCQLAIANRLGSRAISKGLEPKDRKCW